MTPSNSPNPQSLASSYQKRQERGSEGRGKPERRVKEEEERERWKERERARGKLAPWEFPLEIDEDTESASSVFPDPAGWYQHGGPEVESTKETAVGPVGA